MSFLTGYKTFIIGAVMMALGVLELLGIMIPGMTGDPVALIGAGLGMITARLGAKTEAAKVGGG